MKLRLSIGASLLLCGSAVAQDVYPGCEVPTTVAGRHTFFIDPVKGSDNGDGSAAKPWKSVTTVFATASRLVATKRHKTPTNSPLLAVDPNAPVKGGDIIMLMSGDYGDVALQNTFNDKFISIMAAPGQKPLFRTLKMNGAARFLLQGITFQSETSPAYVKAGNKIALIADGWGDATTNIVLDTNTFQTASDASRWSDSDWYSKPQFYALGVRASCVAVTNSTFRNIMNGIEGFGAQALYKNNTFDSFSNDAIDLNANNVMVVGNTIKNATNNSQNTQHPDAVQTWASVVSGKTVVNKNLVIDSNKIYTPKGKVGNYLQGLNIGSYYNVVIQNNAIVTNHWIGITLSGAHDSKIVNNTVMPSDPKDHPTWIMIRPSGDSGTQNVIVRNNAAYMFRAEDAGITMDHNVSATGFSKLVNGKAVTNWKSDTALQNIIAGSFTSAFRDWDPTKTSFDLHLKSASALDGMGIITQAPTVDADGRVRKAPMTAGAYIR